MISGSAGARRAWHLAIMVGVWALGAGALDACAPPRFEQYMDAQRWTDAARLFDADSLSILSDDRSLYRAGVLFGTPGRSTFDASRARTLFRRLLTTFPASPYRQDAVERLALLDAIVNGRADAQVQVQALQTRIDALSSTVQRLHAALDSATVRDDSARRDVARLQADLHERDDQLRALRLELQQLKAIDLKPRAGRPPLP